MKRFHIEIVRKCYVTGHFELEAPDEDGAWLLAEDIKYGDERIKWDEHQAAGDNAYPTPSEIYVKEA